MDLFLSFYRKIMDVNFNSLLNYLYELEMGYRKRTTNS